MKTRAINQGIRRVLLGSLSAVVCSFAFAQTAFPTRPITMIVPFPPAGVADIVGRPIAQAMGRDLGQPVVIENKAGAGGGIGMALAARAEPNGYTVLMALSSIVVVPEADKVLNRPEMYQLSQLRPIARFTADPTILVVKADSPWKTYAQFMDYVRANPAKVSYGSSGNYGSMHIPMEQLKVATGGTMLHVPYTGAGPAVTALLAGQVDALSTGPSSVVQQIQAGKLRALAHWGTGRLAVLPDVPSLTELGVPVTYAQWAGLFVPAQVPQPIIDRLRAAARFAATDPATVRSLTAAGTEIQYLDGDDFDQYVKAESADMRKLVQIIGKVE